MNNYDISYSDMRRAARAARILEGRAEEMDRARGDETQLSNEDQKERANRVRVATSDTYHWLRNYTKTFNPHWKEQNRPTAYEPFPDWPFIPITLDYLARGDEKVKLIEKSRTMMVTWVCMGYLTLQAMTVPEREIVVQTMTDDKVDQLIEYAKCLYDSQPSWLKEAFPLPKPIDKQSKKEFRVGSSVIFGIAGGAGQIRSYHPWAYFNDESAFQPEAGECYDEALPACQKIILNSTAAPGWYFDFLADATTATE